MSKRLWNRLHGLVSRVRVALTDNTGKIQRVTAGDDTMEWAEPLGLTTVPLAGAEAVVLSPDGDATHAIVVQIGDRRYRPTGVAPGDTCVWAPNGSRIYLTEDGVAVVVGSGTLQIQSLASGPSGGVNSGLVHGSGIDPFTGLTYFALGNTTAQVKAEKT